MENQGVSSVTSSASSCSPQPKNSKDMIVPVEEPNEQATENNNNNNTNLTLGSSSQEAMSATRGENPSLGSGAAVRTEEELTMLYPSRSDKIYYCQFCTKGFSTTQALGGHQNAHKQDREWEKKRKGMEDDFPGLSYLNRYIEKPHLLLCGYSEDALTNENHLGFSLAPLNHRGSGVAPRITPTRFFTGNTLTDGSSSSRGVIGPRPTHVPMFHRSVPPFLPHHPRTTNRPSHLYPQENRRRSEVDLNLTLGNNNVVVIDDDDDQPEEENPKNWGTDLSL